MSDRATKRGVGVIALVVSLAGISCVPKIANLSKNDTVPQAVVTHVANDARLLVLPLWSETRGYSFRDPYIITASAIGTREANVPRRTGFYFDWFVCGGPSKFVVGYLVVAANGTFVWSDVRGERQSRDSATLKKELIAMVSVEDVGPQLRSLMEFGTSEIRFHADEDDGRSTLQFLEGLPEEQ